MISSMGTFLSSDFQGDITVRCPLCQRKLRKTEQWKVDEYALENHMILTHMPPSEVSKELRRNIGLGHP